MNNQLALTAIQQSLDKGVREFCIAPGKRNASLVYALADNKEVMVYYWPEERSAAFFALGRIRATQRPVAVITTSGTAVGNLLPAAMEAYYTHLPLLLITADRPRKLRGTGAPQSAEQVGIFSYYTQFMQDLAGDEECYLNEWSLQGPAHLNICFEEPTEEECEQISGLNLQFKATFKEKETGSYCLSPLKEFLNAVNFPLVIVGALKDTEKESVVQFLLHLKAPLYAEASSGIREDPRLAYWRVSVDQVWKKSAEADYPIDSILRIGSIPTSRIWRDLEDKKGLLEVCSISNLPFSGLSWAGVVVAPLVDLFQEALTLPIENRYPCEKWLKKEKELEQYLTEIYLEEPTAEMSLIHHLSKLIPAKALVYLGNSLPVREWDQSATWESKNFKVAVSRGVCGIDGQIAQFLGLSTIHQENWAIIGDLTALYDLVAPWILQQLPHLNVNLVVINNGGGRIFSRIFSSPVFLNQHKLQFRSLADFWGWHYEEWHRIPNDLKQTTGGRLIEILPDEKATQRALKKIKKL